MAEAFHIRDDFNGGGVLNNHAPQIQEGAAQGLRWDAWDIIEDDETQTGWLIADGRILFRENYY
ncbi:hypothetical protein [Comamonas sp. MYb396]|uniref:hypothetical protein n=1 Tax=Comamonas sp. MYb396 TaxID=2745302 RepID=UPI0030A720F3